MTGFTTALEQCDLCEDIRPCIPTFCTQGHLHWLCLPCGKSAQAHGQAVEVRMAVQAVDLSPDNFGGGFSRGGGCTCGG